jgi:hypothetical protein
MIELPNHADETCVIIGNGASLQGVPKSWLKGYITFGCNYLCRWVYQPTYYVCIDSQVLANNSGEIYTIASMAKLAFISNYPMPNPFYDRLMRLPNIVPIGKDSVVFEHELYMSGNTATYVSLKLAFFMNFARVLLVGVDHDAGWQHFSPDYPGTGHVTTNFEGQRYHYQLAQTIYSENGREIINLSPSSALDKIFRHDSLTSYL